jgi:hypothetical protein
VLSRPVSPAGYGAARLPAGVPPRVRLRSPKGTRSLGTPRGDEIPADDPGSTAAIVSDRMAE